jgi:hypothetical protein
LKRSKKQSKNLAPQELERFRGWFDNFDSARFDEKIERDVQSGRLDELAKQALAAHRDGGSREL